MIVGREGEEVATPMSLKQGDEGVAAREVIDGREGEEVGTSMSIKQGDEGEVGRPVVYGGRLSMSCCYVDSSESFLNSGLYINN